MDKAMHSEWSTFQSFQQGQALLDAINTLALHLALEPGQESKRLTEDSDDAVKESVQLLDSFLEELGAYLAVRDRRTPILGAGPRQRQLAERIAEARQRPQQFHSPLVTVGTQEVQTLLHADWNRSATAREQLLDSLEELRAIVEEHLHADASKLLGEI